MGCRELGPVVSPQTVRLVLRPPQSHCPGSVPAGPWASVYSSAGFGVPVGINYDPPPHLPPMGSEECVDCLPFFLSSGTFLYLSCLLPPRCISEPCCPTWIKVDHSLFQNHSALMVKLPGRRLLAHLPSLILRGLSAVLSRPLFATITLRILSSPVRAPPPKPLI